MSGKVYRGRLSRYQSARLGRLLNMMYKPSEIANEIGFDTRQFYTIYIPLGLPHEKDPRNRIWINGIVFKDWINGLYTKEKMEKDKAYCLSCKNPVQIENPKWLEKSGVFYLVCKCPICGRKLAKITDRKVS